MREHLQDLLLPLLARIPTADLSTVISAAMSASLTYEQLADYSKYGTMDAATACRVVATLMEAGEKLQEVEALIQKAHSQVHSITPTGQEEPPDD